MVSDIGASGALREIHALSWLTGLLNALTRSSLTGSKCLGSEKLIVSPLNLARAALKSALSGGVISQDDPVLCPELTRPRMASDKRASIFFKSHSLIKTGERNAMPTVNCETCARQSGLGLSYIQKRFATTQRNNNDYINGWTNLSRISSGKAKDFSIR